MEALFNQSNRSKVEIFTYGTSLSRDFRTSGSVLRKLTSSLGSTVISSDPQRFFEADSVVSSPSSRWGKKRLF